MSLLRDVTYERIDVDTLNACLTLWQHKMGPLRRPNAGHQKFHALIDRYGGPCAVTASMPLVRETCAGLDRTEAIELARVCAATPALCRVVLRLWREFVFPLHGRKWAVSYQDAVEHTGNLYRFDGWVPIGRSSSGTDQRSGRKGRRKVIWGFSHDEALMRARAREYGANLKRKGDDA